MTDVTRAAELLLAARQGGEFLLQSLPEDCFPMNREEALAMQARVAEASGPRSGWKVGLAGAMAPMFVATTAAGSASEPAVLVGPYLRDRVIEGEVAFRLGRDLPPRGTPYSRAEVEAAIATAHPAIEVVETRFVERPADPLLALADNGNHGAFVYGPGLADWRALSLETLPVRLDDGATCVKQGEGGNPAGDIVALVVWLANEGSVAAGGLRAGEFVTTGTYTGVYPAAEGATVTVTFDGLGSAAVSFPVASIATR